MTERIITIFKKEFGEIADRFDVSYTPLATEDIDKLTVCQPGVYVFVRGNDVIKVGRHLTNVKKRSLEHVRDNTGGIMTAMMGAQDSNLMLLSLKPNHNRDYHWVCALGVFLEVALEPVVRSGRLA